MKEKCGRRNCWSRIGQSSGYLFRAAVDHGEAKCQHRHGLDEQGLLAHRRYDATRRGQFNEEDHDYQKPQKNDPRSEHGGLSHKKNGVKVASGVDAEGREYGGDEKVAESGKLRGEATE